MKDILKDKPYLDQILARIEAELPMLGIDAEPMGVFRIVVTEGGSLPDRYDGQRFVALKMPLKKDREQLGRLFRWSAFVYDAESGVKADWVTSKGDVDMSVSKNQNQVIEVARQWLLNQVSPDELRQQFPTTTASTQKG